MLRAIRDEAGTGFTRGNARADHAVVLRAEGNDAESTTENNREWEKTKKKEKR